MRDGKEIWEAASRGTKTGDGRSVKVMRMYGLAQILAQAETAILQGQDQEAIKHLQCLQTLTGDLLTGLTQQKMLAAA
jgi:hypothetical protein